MADKPEPDRPRSGTTRWLPWLLVLVVAIPLVRSCVRTREAQTAADSTTTPAAQPVDPDTNFVPAPDTTPKAHPEQRHVTRPAHKQPVHKDSLKKETLGENIDKLGGGPEPVTPAGQGAMGGDGPSGQAQPSKPAKVEREKAPTSEGAMGGDGPTGKR